MDELYRCFATAELSEPLNACMHCFTPSDLQYLRETPRSSLSHGDLSLISSKLVSTLGTPKDIAYFVPRIVEAIAEGALIDVEPFGERLAQMPPEEWTKTRRRALAQVFRLFFMAADGTLDDLAMESTREALKRSLPSLFR